MKNPAYSVFIAILSFCFVLSADGKEKKKETPKKSTPAVTSGWIHVNLSEQTLTYSTSETGRSFKVSTGKPSTPTPTGTFTITAKDDLYELQEVKNELGRSVMVPWWMTIDASRGIAIHGVKNIWGGAYPGSGACIRMQKEDAEWLFARVKHGTKVTIEGSEKEYLAKNQVYPWQREGERDLIEPRPNGDGFQFKRQIDDEMAATYFRLIREKRLGVYHPSPVQIRKDPRWKDGLFVNFPNIAEMGIISEQSYDQCLKRYMRISELEGILGGTARINR